MILTFGSINADLIVPVPNLPRPGETVLGGSYELLPGGKGANQALAARRAGADVLLAGAVGRDGFAAIALASLRRDGVDTRLVRQIELPTGCASIMVSAAGENIIAVAPGANMGVRCDWVSEDLLDTNTTLVAQLEVPPGETQALIRRVRRRGGRCVLNLAPALPIDLALLPEIDLLVANESEAATMSSDPMGIARRLRQGLVVTRGAAGARVFLADGSRLDLPALAIDPVDTTGAGDTFVGVLAGSLDLGASLEGALRRASAAAGLACLAHGAQTAMPGSAAIEAVLLKLG
ncbi:MAG TPA: ribokinase [Stellaceae bacterium]|jgi:ribokinase|nr:ribokinase [Stellaceae bacterium]